MVGHIEASMRPRVFPAEDLNSGIKTTASTVGFNEAAGIPRGRRGGIVAAIDTEGRMLQ